MAVMSDGEALDRLIQSPLRRFEEKLYLNEHHDITPKDPKDYIGHLGAIAEKPHDDKAV